MPAATPNTWDAPTPPNTFAPSPDHPKASHQQPRAHRPTCALCLSCTKLSHVGHGVDFARRHLRRQARTSISCLAQASKGRKRSRFTPKQALGRKNHSAIVPEETWDRKDHSSIGGRESGGRKKHSSTGIPETPCRKNHSSTQMREAPSQKNRSSIGPPESPCPKNHSSIGGGERRSAARKKGVAGFPR
jgi:hypothetical protein